MRVIRRLHCCLILVGAFALSSPVAAQGHYSEEDLVAARDLFQAGIALLDRGRYAEACAKFEASLQRVAGLGTRGKLAECYEKAGRIASAWRQYREIQDVANLSGDSLREQVAGERAAKLESRLPYLIIEARNKALEETITIEHNGGKVAPDKWNRRLPVDPGNHVVTVFVAGKRVWFKAVIARESAVSTITVPDPEVIGLGRPGDSSGSENRELGPRSSRHSPRSPESPELPELINGQPRSAQGGPADAGRSDLKLPGMILVGVGAASLVAGGLFSLRARSLWNDAEDDCTPSGSPRLCDEPGFSTSQRAHDNASYAGIAVGVGLAVAATGGVLWWLSRSRGDSPSIPEAPEVGLSIGDEGAGVWVSGRF